ncbi:GvpL/GvpF family gas vesicle protein [Streptomyces sp. B6B3]|uniref:GvpL/GvpF family gas vesicle protein n=1 Tax=Streptomyces sp. B6B3 TaxID=3153570 RepID=UPI00325F8082
MSESLWYVYAVTPAGGADPPPGPGGPGRYPHPAELLTGVAGGQVRAVPEGELAAVVSPVAAEDFAEGPLRAHLEDLRWLERTARDHQHVVDALLSAGCVVPLRLATVCRGTAGVRRLVAEHRELFATAVTRLDGRAEWGLKINVDPPSSHDAPMAAEPANGDAGRPASGRDYLRRRREQRQRAEDAWRLAEAAAREVHEALAATAERTRLHPPQDARLSGEPGRNLLNAAYLVPRHRESEFAELAGQLAGEVTGLRITLSGPWAPYSFTTDAAEVSAEAPETAPEDDTTHAPDHAAADASGDHASGGPSRVAEADVRVAKDQDDRTGSRPGTPARPRPRAEACAADGSRTGARVTAHLPRTPGSSADSSGARENTGVRDPAAAAGRAEHGTDARSRTDARVTAGGTRADDAARADGRVSAGDARAGEEAR